MTFDSLSILEKDTLIEFFNMGMSKSADAMATLTDERILIKCTEILKNCDPRHKIQNESLVLSTQIMGEIEGQCCLVLNFQEANYLAESAFGWQRPGGQTLISDMDKSFLLELDNIITAAFITQLSSKLNMTMYGGVPKLYVGKEFLKSFDSKDHLELLYFNTSFQIRNASFRPGYYWFMEQKVYDKLLKAINS